VYQTTTWDISNPRRTTTVAPTEGPVSFTDVPVLTGGTTTSAPPAPITTATAYLTTMFVATGGTTTTTPIAPSPTVVVGSVTATFSTRNFYFPDTAASSPKRTFTFTSTSVNVCRNGTSSSPTSFKGLLNSSGSPTSVGSSACNTGIYAGYATRGTVNNTARVVAEPYDVKTTYAVHTTQNVYREYTMRRDYDVYEAFDTYHVYTASVGTATVTTTGVIYGRVRVCDDTEKTSRTDLCQRYPDGNYKPVGEIQRYATGVRVAAFGYLNDNSSSRYGGVLRAPMKFAGPTYIDPNGQPQTNSNAEWNVNNGVYASDPLGASPTYTYSGVINYLNRFGTTAATKGVYKGLDPVGELYYEALRYFQGLAPTASATASVTAGMDDGFPYYTTAGTAPAKWQDPLQNACERRNYILTIGDVNTHYDKQLPGHRSPNGVNSFLTEDPARAAETIPGSTATFNAVSWTDLLTGFETASSKSYVDSLGRSQNTLGNPNANANNTTLDTKATGSGGHSAYYWAGAAYWANTQAIRRDVKDSLSMKDIRVKSFVIDVDEGGNGDIEDTNPRGIKPRRSAAYLAGKYGWFNDANLDGNPFKTSGGLTNNSEWQDPTAPNTPDGYVIASQAQKLIGGLRKFFRAASSIRGAASVSAISTSRFTSNAPNGDFFAPLFYSGNWTGTVQRTRLLLNTSTGEIESTPGVVWDAGEILSTGAETASTTVSDPYVKPANRNIFTMATISGTTQGIPFKVANKDSLDAAVLTSLNTNPATSVTDNLADIRINWLRGDRSNETSDYATTIRVRGSVMGDVINSGPVYKEGVDLSLSGPGYLTFAQSVSGRTGMIYVGANDGMLHAFRASDGKELFAYIPRAVATHLNKLTHPGYVHRPYVDAVPLVTEAQIGSNWKTLLVSGMGGGAQGLFALDVTSPSSFGVDNVLFEFTDADDPLMGNIVTEPVLVKLKVPGTGYKWFIAVGSGYNNYKADGAASSTGAQAMFFISIDKAANASWQEGSNYFKVVLPVANSAIVNGLSNPGFVTGAAGEATLMYAGDLQGNLWKFDLSDGISSSTLATSVFQSGGVRKALFIAKNASDTLQPITTSPQVVEANTKGYMVVFGTGKFVEPSDTSTADVQSIYGIWDSLETTASRYTVPRTSLYPRSATLSGTSVVISTTTFEFGFDTTATPAQYRGWLLNLPETRERIAVQSALGIGVVAFSAAIPEGTCSGDGTGRQYCLNPVQGVNVGCSTAATPGIPTGPKIIQFELEASSYSARTPTGGRTVTIEQKILSSSTKITDAGNALVSSTTVPSVKIPGGRVSWRELRQ
jgi:type IV pilus assembly protein PilY1